MRVPLLFLLLFASTFSFSQNTDRAPEDTYELTVEPAWDGGESDPDQNWTPPPRPPADPNRVTQYRENNLIGLKRGETILTPAIYSWIDFSGSMYGPTSWAKRDGRYGVITRDGRELIPCEFDSPVDVLDFGNMSLYHVKQNGKSGVMDTTQTIRIPLEYEALHSTVNGVYVRLNDKMGFYNSQLQCIVAPECDQLNLLHNLSSLLVCAQGDQTRIVHASDGRNVVPAAQSIEGLEDAWHNGGYHLESRLYNQSLKSKFVYRTSEGQCGVLDALSGKVIVLPTFDEITQCLNRAEEDYYIVGKRGRYGVLNDQQQLVIPMNYDSLVFDCIDPKWTKGAPDFPILAKKKRKWGVILANGEVAIPMRYDAIHAISGGDAQWFRALQKGKWVALDASGELLSSQQFDHIGWRAQGSAACIANGQLHYLRGKNNLSEPIKAMDIPQGYATLDALCEAFAEALMAPDDEAMRAFTRNICPSDYTMDFMIRTGFGYRGIPDKMVEQGLTVDFIVESQLDPLLRFRGEGYGSDRPILSSRFEEDDPVQIDTDLNIRAIESSIELRLTPMYGMDKRRVNFGELLFIDGFWLLFTRPSGS